MPARPALRPLVAAVVLLSAAGSARADTVSFSGSRTGNDPVSFSGTLEFNPTTSNVLKITLNNTTSTGDAVTHGFITGFGFNVPAGVTAGSPTSTDADFRLLNAASHSTSLQGGEFDYAFSTGSQLHSVSSSQIARGLGAGQSATFEVTLSGNVSGLTAAGIFAEMSASPETPFSVRFRSTNTNLYRGAIGDGDKVVAKADPTPNAVPAPPAVVLAGVGFGCLVLGRFRRRAA